MKQLPAYSNDFLRELLQSFLKNYLREEIEFRTDIFCENGHDRKTLAKVINSFEKRTRGINNNNKNNNTNKKHCLERKNRIKNQKRNTKIWI